MDLNDYPSDDASSCYSSFIKSGVKSHDAWMILLSFLLFYKDFVIKCTLAECLLSAQICNPQCKKEIKLCKRSFFTININQINASYFGLVVAL